MRRTLGTALLAWILFLSTHVLCAGEMVRVAAKPAGINDSVIPDYQRASCRVSSHGWGVTERGREWLQNIGSGCVIDEDANYYYAITNDHIMKREKHYVEFVLFGQQSGLISAELIWQRPDPDLAVLRIDKQSLGGHTVPVITLAGPDYMLQQREQVLSVGCARGKWQTSWSGHVKGRYGNLVAFVPMAALGRSGSPVFSADGSKVVAVIVARSKQEGSLDGANESDGVGYAIPTSVIWPAFGVAQNQPQQQLQQQPGQRRYIDPNCPT